jgi:hypothetical protein
VLTWADSTTFAVVLYAIAGVTAVALGVAERRHGSAADPRLWPVFWFTTGALLLSMAVARASNASEFLTDIGRSQARSEGWYETRRVLQAWVIGIVTAAWGLTVVFAVWRVPERRRRYLPTAIAVFTLVCFIGIRMISLHQVDAVLHDHDLGGVTLGAVVEIALLLSVVITSVRRIPRSTLEPSDAHDRPQVEAGAVGVTES